MSFALGIKMWSYSVFLSIPMFYLGGIPFFSLLYFFKWTRWLFYIYVSPVFLIYPISKDFKICMRCISRASLVGFLIFGILCLYEYFFQDIVFDLKLYIIITLTSIIATQDWIKTVFEFIFGRDEKFCYNPTITKYLIYVFYFVVLVITNIISFNFSETANSVFVASFATFLAYDRLVANRKILNNTELVNIKSFLRLNKKEDEHDSK